MAELPPLLVNLHLSISSWADPEGGGGGQGVRTPLKNHKNTGFLRNTGPDPLKSKNDIKPAFNVGPSLARQRNAI